MYSGGTRVLPSQLYAWVALGIFPVAFDPNIFQLTFTSLLGGLGASRPVETLDRTGGFDASVVRRRLLETTQHILGVHDGIDAIQPGGHGWEASVRVRLLHASVRQRITKLAAVDPGYYDLGKNGVPINDLDCIGTMNTFSATLIWLGLPRQGVWLRRQEIRDYLALWRWVSHLMGTPHGWLARPETAKAMMESLLASEIAPSPKSGVLANNIILGLEGNSPTYASRGFLSAQAYWQNGHQLCREMHIPEPSLYHTSLVLGQCLVFMMSGYVTRSIPCLDRRNIKVRLCLIAPHVFPDPDCIPAGTRWARDRGLVDRRLELGLLATHLKHPPARLTWQVDDG